MFGQANNSNNIPWYYQPYQQPQQQSNGIIWIQGEAGAKAYPVAPGQAIQLMDSEETVFYIKSADVSGMPMPLRKFRYTEEKDQSAKQQAEYITREEFNKTIAELRNGQSTLSAAE